MYFAKEKHKYQPSRNPFTENAVLPTNYRAVVPQTFGSNKTTFYVTQGTHSLGHFFSDQEPDIRKPRNLENNQIQLF